MKYTKKEELISLIEKRERILKDIEGTIRYYKKEIENHLKLKQTIEDEKHLMEIKLEQFK